MSQRKILITGGQGQLGQALQEEFSDYDIRAWDIDELDIADLEAVQKAIHSVRPHVVLNAAGYTQVDQAETHQEAAFKGNALGPRNLALATHALHIPLVHFSTDYVFDGAQTRPYHEFDRPNPLSVYGLSKLAGEEAIRQGNPRHYVIRTSWLYHGTGKNFALTMCRLAEKGQVRVVNDQFGSPTYAPHLAKGVARILETEAYGTYHLAGKGEATWYDLTRALYQELGLSTSVIPITTEQYPQAARRPSYSVLTTLQEPHILLPPWQDGVRDFAQGKHGA